MAAKALSALGRRTADPPISWLMKMALDRPELISLAAGFTDSESLPVREARSALNAVLRPGVKARAALQYGGTAGDPELRRQTALHLARLDSAAVGKPSRIHYSPDQILITNGSQQLLYLVTESLCDPGDIVLVEDPTYFVHLGIAQSHGLRCRGIPLESDGLDLKALDRVLNDLKKSGELRRTKLLYLVSYFQNPSGVTTAFAKKRGALELLSSYERAAGHPIYLLEDAAYRELRFAGPDTPSALAAGRRSERVIYAGTYSKPFATGARVGFGFLPDELFKVVYRLKANHDFGTSNLLQQLLLHALSTCAYSHHLDDLKRRYERKAEVMLKSLRAHFPASASWEAPRGGLYAWVRLPSRFRTGVGSACFRQAVERDVLYVPGELCYADDPARRKPASEMRLSFGGASLPDIRAGIGRLGAVLRKLKA